MHTMYFTEITLISRKNSRLDSELSWMVQSQYYLCDCKATTSWQSALRDIAGITPSDSYRHPQASSTPPSQISAVQIYLLRMHNANVNNVGRNVREQSLVKYIYLCIIIHIYILFLVFIKYTYIYITNTIKKFIYAFRITNNFLSSETSNMKKLNVISKCQLRKRGKLV